MDDTMRLVEIAAGLFVVYIRHIGREYVLGVFPLKEAMLFNGRADVE